MTNLNLLPNYILISFPLTIQLQLENACNTFNIRHEDFLSKDDSIHNKVINVITSYAPNGLGTVATVELLDKTVDLQIGDQLRCTNVEYNFESVKPFDIDWNASKIYYITEFLPSTFNSIIIK